MPLAEPADLEPFLDQFRQAVEDCENLYQSCARDCVDSGIELHGQSRGEFVQRMADLSHGLVLRVFVDVGHANGRWTPEVLALAAELFEHLYGKRLKTKQLKEALTHFRRQSGLTWDVLLGPFQRLGPFRGRGHKLRTVVTRLANVIAKANGQLTPEEVHALRAVLSQVRRVVEPIPLAEAGPDPPPDHGSVALQEAAPFEIRLDDAQAAQPKAVVVEEKPAEERLQEALAELDSLIGLTTIKHEVRSLVNLLKLQQARKQFDLPQTEICLHSVFSGNPGTGKTTVARLLGRIFGALGLLKRGHLVEIDRSGLVAEYAGQTAPKAHKKIDESRDGVLFIDEAYSLVAEHGDDPYGTEALQVLLKRMEDDRDRLVVVLAGYPEPMRRLVRSNPGLSSRFSRHFNFPDYTAAELGRIFERLCAKNRYALTPATRLKLLLGFDHLVAHRDEHFGNGRLARNVFERAVGQLANRIIGVVPLTSELLTTLRPEDVAFDDVPDEVWADPASGGRCFCIECPGCRQESRAPLQYLGRQVECKRCRQAFFADWGEVRTA